MKMQAKLLTLCGLATISSLSFGQNYLAESEAAIGMQGEINNQMAPGLGGPPPAPGMVPGVANPNGGFAPGQPGGNSMPGLPGEPGGDPGLGDMGMEAQPGLAGQPAAVPAPDPIKTEEVLVGRRVLDAVSGGMLEDVVKISIRASDLDSYVDDGISDNGIAGDGIHGNVNTSRSEFIGQFSNTTKNYLIHAVNNAEQIDPMVYYGYHIAKVDPAQVEGLTRYGLPLPGEQDSPMAPKVAPDFASIIDLEHDRDELVRQWNYEFLANYRVIPSDPQSEYFPVFIPSPPLTPANYPVPTGYVAPQSVKKAAQANLATQAATALATQQVAPRGGGNNEGDPGGLF